MSDDISGEMIAMTRGDTRDQTPTERLRAAANKAKLFYASAAKVAPSLKMLDFKTADEIAATILMNDNTPFLMTREYQNFRRDFKNMEKIKKLLNAYNFRTAKIEYDLKDLGLGGYAYENFYKRAKDEAIKSAGPVLKEKILEADYETAKNIATEYLKTYDGAEKTNYEKLVALLEPKMHYYFDNEYLYAPIDVDASTPNNTEHSEDALSAVQQIASGEDKIEKFLSVIWLLDNGFYDYLAEFSEYDFLNTGWFSELLKSSVGNSDIKPKQIIEMFLENGLPHLARRVFNMYRSLSEEDYYYIVEKVAHALEKAGVPVKIKINDSEDMDSAEDVSEIAEEFDENETELGKNNVELDEYETEFEEDYDEYF
ncbi:hypothetical protein IKE84_00830 [Candidatus Saccharibacteria bacterium]|nr:hypothetical protein [Candidatus Saccharibacteria bacterium]